MEKLTTHEQMMVKVRNAEDVAKIKMEEARLQLEKAESAFRAIQELRYGLEAIAPKSELKAA